jgi:hypothetical protein
LSDWRGSAEYRMKAAQNLLLRLFLEVQNNKTPGDEIPRDLTRPGEIQRYETQGNTAMQRRTAV